MYLREWDTGDWCMVIAIGLFSLSAILQVVALVLK